MRAKEEHDHISFTFIRFLRSAFAFPGGSVVKNLPANVGDIGSIPGLRRSRDGNGNPLPVFLSGKSHGQRSQGG